MAIYDYSIKGKQVELSKFDEENPFVFLAIYRSLPSNYFGAFQGGATPESPGWYYDTSKKMVIYIGQDKGISEYKMIYLKRSDGLGVLELVSYKSPKR